MYVGMPTAGTHAYERECVPQWLRAYVHLLSFPKQSAAQAPEAKRWDSLFLSAPLKQMVQLRQYKEDGYFQVVIFI